jgi:hypothetical protein
MQTASRVNPSGHFPEWVSRATRESEAPPCGAVTEGGWHSENRVPWHWS